MLEIQVSYNNQLLKDEWAAAQAEIVELCKNIITRGESPLLLNATYTLTNPPLSSPSTVRAPDSGDQRF